MATTTLTIIPLDAADPAAVDGAHRVRAAAVANDVPDFPEPSRYQFEAELRVPWPGEDVSHWIARRDDGEIVGYLSVVLPTLDNLENAFIDPIVTPRFRRQGIGRALFERAVAHARANGRRRVMAHSVHALPGGVPRDPASHAFAERVGLRPALEEIRRRLDLAAVDHGDLDGLLAQARAASAGYSLVRWRDVVPEEHIADVAYLDSDFINQAPMGDLALEAEKIDAARIRANEAARKLHGRTVVSTGAVHDATGRMVALSALVRQAQHVEHVGQGITLVDPAHRGHRLGLLTKVENLRYAIDEFPGMRYIDTWNAAVNAHMIAINERMGFRPVDAWFDRQADI
jgi:GNAT superfamily N-acetyltransferase